MKKSILMLFLLSITYSIFCIEIPDSTKTNTYNVNLSYSNTSKGLYSGSIGIGKIQHLGKSTKEITANFHYQMNSDYYVTGVYGQINSYRNING